MDNCDSWAAAGWSIYEKHALPTPKFRAQEAVIEDTTCSVMFWIQQGETIKYLVPPPKPRGEGNALSRRTDGRRAKRGRAPADGGEADLVSPAVGGEVDPGVPAGGREVDLGAPAVGRELDPGAPDVCGEVEPDAPVISGEVKATGALTSPAASAGAHKPVTLTSIIVQHASSAPMFSDETPISGSLWVSF